MQPPVTSSQKKLGNLDVIETLIGINAQTPQRTVVSDKQTAELLYKLDAQNNVTYANPRVVDALGMQPMAEALTKNTELTDAYRDMREKGKQEPIQFLVLTLAQGKYDEEYAKAFQALPLDNATLSDTEREVLKVALKKDFEQGMNADGFFSTRERRMDFISGIEKNISTINNYVISDNAKNLSEHDTLYLAYSTKNLSNAKEHLEDGNFTKTMSELLNARLNFSTVRHLNEQGAEPLLDVQKNMGVMIANLDALQTLPLQVNNKPPRFVKLPVTYQGAGR